MIEVAQTETFKAWLQGLKDSRARAIIAERIGRVAAGLLGDVAPIGGGLSELRIHYGPGYRVYLAKRGASYVILLCGGDKGTQTRDIKRAQALALEL